MLNFPKTFNFPIVFDSHMVEIASNWRSGFRDEHF